MLSQTHHAVTTIPAARRSVGSAFSSGVAATFAFPLRLIRFWRMRHQLSGLACLDHHALRDIGLTPMDVADAVASIPEADPWRLLSDRIADRNSRRPRILTRGPWAAPGPATTGSGKVAGIRD
jgi:uncharacterized protein YjiS (DUF1127 family)